MEVVYTKNIFTHVKNITWIDIIEKMSLDFKNKTCKSICNDVCKSPTILCQDQSFKGNLLTAYNEVCALGRYSIMHIYTSFSGSADTFGKHSDNDDVLIVQALGNVTYVFDNAKKYDLSPGDCLFIPRGVYHTPITHGERITLSFSK